MKLLYFTHSLRSCWNHGNAHFLRGVLRELVDMGHDVIAYEPADSWSLQNLLKDQGEEGLHPFYASYPELNSEIYPATPDLDRLLDGADVVIVHEWNTPKLVAAIGAHHSHGGHYTLLFHDTHHRAISAPDELSALDLSGYDGVLTFGETLAEIYRQRGWGTRAFVWHEAADIRLFHPPVTDAARAGLVWIGNWGDGERSAEIGSFLLRPSSAAALPLDIYGVRYPQHGLATLSAYGASYRGWLANALVPKVFARHLATVHVPRRFYVSHLPGIPTIRVFEALACGIPLASAYWRDTEGLFSPGRDFLIARNSAEMERHLKALANDAGLRQELARNGLEAIRALHTCKHRAGELLRILQGFSQADSTPQLEAAR